MIWGGAKEIEKKFLEALLQEKKILEGHSPILRGLLEKKIFSRRGFRGKKIHFENFLRPHEIVNGRPLRFYSLLSKI